MKIEILIFITISVSTTEGILEHKSTKTDNQCGECFFGGFYISNHYDYNNIFLFHLTIKRKYDALVKYW